MELRLRVHVGKGGGGGVGGGWDGWSLCRSCHGKHCHKLQTHHYLEGTNTTDTECSNSNRLVKANRPDQQQQAGVIWSVCVCEGRKGGGVLTDEVGVVISKALHC